MTSLVFSEMKSYRHRLMAIGILILSTWMSLGLLIGRWIVVGHLQYGYLVWDLFLAWMPFWISVGIHVLHQRGSRDRTLFFLGLVWLLFFPNAPYLMTEFVHLGRRHDGAWWCDMVVMFGFAWNGLMLGLTSLYCLQKFARARIGARGGRWMAAAVLLLGSFGISLGRFERFDSWDVIRRPVSLLAGVLDQILHPSEYPKPFAIACLLCGFMSLAYLTLWTLVTLNEDNATDPREWKGEGVV